MANIRTQVLFGFAGFVLLETGIRPNINAGEHSVRRTEVPRPFLLKKRPAISGLYASAGCCVIAFFIARTIGAPITAAAAISRSILFTTIKSI